MRAFFSSLLSLGIRVSLALGVTLPRSHAAHPRPCFPPCAPSHRCVRAHSGLPRRPRCTLLGPNQLSSHLDIHFHVDLYVTATLPPPTVHLLRLVFMRREKKARI